jgi:hypothetical protein
MEQEKAYNVTIYDKGKGDFTIGYWYGTKTHAITEAKKQYPGHDRYTAVQAF